MPERKPTQTLIISIATMRFIAKSRKNVYLCEIKIISLYIHDCQPYNYTEQEIGAGDSSLSKQYIFFSPFDRLPITRKKWKDFIGGDYDYFWNSFTSYEFENLNDHNYVKFDDLF